MNILESNKPFSDGLSKLIKDKGLRQVYVAQKAGFTQQELSDMLNGRRFIKAHDISCLAKALAVTPNDIYVAGGGEIK